MKLKQVFSLLFLATLFLGINLGQLIAAESNTDMADVGENYRCRYCRTEHKGIDGVGGSFEKERHIYYCEDCDIIESNKWK